MLKWAISSSSSSFWLWYLHWRTLQGHWLSHDLYKWISTDDWQQVVYRVWPKTCSDLISALYRDFNLLSSVDTLDTATVHVGFFWHLSVLPRVWSDRALAATRQQWLAYIHAVLMSLLCTHFGFTNLLFKNYSSLMRFHLSTRQLVLTSSACQWFFHSEVSFCFSFFFYSPKIF